MLCVDVLLKGIARGKAGRTQAADVGRQRRRILFKSAELARHVLNKLRLCLGFGNLQPLRLRNVGETKLGLDAWPTSKAPPSCFMDTSGQYLGRNLQKAEPRVMTATPPLLLRLVQTAKDATRACAIGALPEHRSSRLRIPDVRRAPASIETSRVQPRTPASLLTALHLLLKEPVHDVGLGLYDSGVHMNVHGEGSSCLLQIQRLRQLTHPRHGRHEGLAVHARRSDLVGFDVDD